MLRPMTKLYLIAIQDQRDRLVERLQELSVLHIEPIEIEGLEGPEAPDLPEDRRQVENLRVRARGLLEICSEVGGSESRVESESPEGKSLSSEQVEELERIVGTLVIERDELAGRYAADQQITEVITAVETIIADLDLTDTQVIPLITEARGPIAEVEAVLNRHLPDRFQLGHHKLSDGRWAVLVAVDPEYAGPVRAYLLETGFHLLTFPPHLSEAKFIDAIAQIKRELEELPDRLAEIDRQLKEFSKEWSDRLSQLTWTLENRLAQIDAIQRFGYTRYTVIISGWVPTDELKSLKKTLTEEFTGIVIREHRGHVPREAIPVAFQNNRWAAPYETLLSILPRPIYNTIDPTPLVSTFFPLFFGIMAGDFGYGAGMVTLALYLRRRFRDRKRIKDAGTILLQAGAVTVAFGIGFGEYFGFGAPWPHFSRAEHRMQFLTFAIALGVAHVLLGLALGAVNALRNRERRHLVEKSSTLVLLIGIGLLVGEMIGFVPDGMRNLGIGLLIIGIPLLIYGGGIMGVLEIFSSIGNILSYARIMAIGTASLLLAETANELGGITGNVATAILIGILFHSLNFVLAIFDPTIQAARLHFVEFFKQFLEAGGKPYRPLMDFNEINE
ncbi:MAG: V-type ATP synthase subunit I [Candidatus Bipolaricaulia bacterium]